MQDIQYIFGFCIEYIIENDKCKWHVHISVDDDDNHFGPIMAIMTHFRENVSPETTIL